MVDPELQVALIARMAAYFCLAIFLISLPPAICGTWLEPDIPFVDHLTEVWTKHWPIFAGACALLPFALFDMLKFSNRFAGPVYRMRKALDCYVSQGELPRFKVRKKDFWQDMIEDFNQLGMRLNTLEEELDCQGKTQHPSSATSPDSNINQEDPVTVSN